MAATVAASKSYDLSGGALREDLQDIIYDLSPMDTWFLSHAGRGKAKSTTHEWLTDSLTAPSATTAIEGDAFTAVARTLPSRLKNYTCINRVDFEVTGTSRAVDNAGMDELLAYHTARAAKELKRNIETALLGNYPASAGTSVSPRVSAAVGNWLYTNNHIKLTAQASVSTTAPVSGFATAAIIGGLGGTAGVTSATAFLVADLNSMLQQAWSTGGEVDTILTTAGVYGTISAFTGLATRFRDVQSRSQAQIIGAADVFVSAFGSHNIRISRYMPANWVFALDMNTWSVAYLRPYQTIEIAKIGDGDRRTILAEWTLVAKQPLANTKATGAV
jgi:hypothetical protein